MEYYLKDTDKPDGPYDLMAIIRKVRNGTVKQDTPIAASLFEEGKPAAEYPELKDFFSEEREELQSIASIGRPRGPRTFKSLLRSGAEFLKQNHFSAVFSGLFMIAWLLIAAIFIFQKGVVSSTIGIALCYFLMGGYLFGIVRYARGNPVTPGLIIGRIGQTAVNMLMVSLVVAVVMLPGVMLAAIMGADMLFISMPVLFIFLLVVLTFLAFTPLLITDKRRDFWDAIQGSARFITANKGQYLGTLFALIALNFLLLPLMPVILPITMGALAEVYDEHFG